MSAGILLFSNSQLLAEEKKANNTIDLSPLSIHSKKVKLKGNIVDSKKFETISNCQITVKIKNSRLLFSSNTMESQDGAYSVLAGFTKHGKVHKKMHLEIKAEGYKTYNGSLYLTSTGCSLHSDEWKYNPGFNPENCPENITKGVETVTSFNFHLIKKSN